MIEQERYLLRACVNGEKTAWNEFVSVYSKLIWHSIRRTLAVYQHDGDASLAEEIYQEFFVTIVAEDAKKLQQFRGDNNCSLASWLRILVSRLTIDFMRKESRRVSHPNIAPRCAETDIMQSLLELEKAASLHRACIALPPRDRKLLELHYENELSPLVVARHLKISVGAFYTQKSRMLGRLRKTFEFASL